MDFESLEHLSFSLSLSLESKAPTEEEEESCRKLDFQLKLAERAREEEVLRCRDSISPS